MMGAHSPRSAPRQNGGDLVGAVSSNAVSSSSSSAAAQQRQQRQQQQSQSVSVRVFVCWFFLVTRSARLCVLTRAVFENGGRAWSPPR